MTPATLAQIHAAAFDHDRPWSVAEFAALLHSPGVVVVGDIRAFAMGRIIAPEIEVLTVACNPVSQRQGLGRCCMETLLDLALARDVTTAFLEVAADNDAARHLYDSMGFAPIGQRRAYYTRKDGTAVDALVLSKPLIA